MLGVMLYPEMAPISHWVAESCCAWAHAVATRSAVARLANLRIGPPVSFPLTLMGIKYGKPCASISALRLPVGFAPFCRRPHYILIGKAAESLSGSLLFSPTELVEYPAHLPSLCFPLS